MPAGRSCQALTAAVQYRADIQIQHSRVGCIAAAGWVLET